MAEKSDEVRKYNKNNVFIPLGINNLSLLYLLFSFYHCLVLK